MSSRARAGFFFVHEPTAGPVRTALKRGWKVELYSWQGGLSELLQSFAYEADDLFSLPLRPRVEERVWP